MISHIQIIIQTLNKLAELDNPKIASKSMKVLTKMFQMKITIPDENVTHGENQNGENTHTKHFNSLFSYYFELIKNPNQLGVCLSVIKKVINESISLKHLFYQSGQFDFFMSTPILQIPHNFLESFISIVASCINQDMCILLPIEIPTQLLSQIVRILSNLRNSSNPNLYPASIIDQCARGCYYYTCINNESKNYFVNNNYHQLLINSMNSTTDFGKLYLISALGLCFTSEGIDEKVSKEIPLEIFKDGLELQDTTARIDVSVAICNVMSKAGLMIEQIFSNGLYQSMITHFISDNFSIRKFILEAICIAIRSIPTSCVQMFVCDQLIHCVEELVESEDPKIEELAHDLVLYLQFDEEHQQIVEEFVEFLTNNEKD
ncbi:hypothetical protein TRFO_27840 [Tritrichomonas foetus]|uniref:RNA polymerase II assembly factor Rtp1 C-terminal domain-containing protein n=1 Tax=Tritrichomonas foetus TaxID=1144522 RepID=A0A1J4K4M4_9EUKA|nr:hypothetical protein TRFO_27840 [Tritrichomonas foetus]|eukprot:OHT04630.1 hypothetical protein TRFO_27840 [Tritrichomonas foetus]